MRITSIGGLKYSMRTGTSQREMIMVVKGTIIKLSTATSLNVPLCVRNCQTPKAPALNSSIEMTMTNSQGKLSPDSKAGTNTRAGAYGKQGNEI